MARLTKDQWAAIRTEWRTGAYSNRELAERYGITETAIRKKIKEEGWTRDLGDAAETRAQRRMIEGNKPESSREPEGCEPEKPKFAEPVRSAAERVGLVEEAILEQIADQRATANLAALARAQDLTAVRNRYLGLIQDVMSGDQQKVADAGPVLLMGRGDSLSGAIKALAAVDESLQKVIRTALGMDREAKRVQVSGPDGGPMQTESKTSVDFSKLSTDQLAALAAVNSLLDGQGQEKGPPRPPVGPA